MIPLRLRQWLAIAGISLLAGIAGVVIGRALLPTAAPATIDFHQFVHEGLDLDANQRAALEQLELRFAARRRARELELRRDNARLAEAIAEEHDAGPKVAAAVNQAHVAMGELQKDTLAHVFAMRKILRPAQAVRFDAAVVRALTEERR